jgi:hypothetical protein
MNSNKPILLLFYNIKKQYLNDSLYYATDVTTNPSNLPLVAKEEPLRTIIFNNSAWIIVLLFLIFIVYIYKWYIINTSKIFESNNYNSKSLSIESIPFFKSMFLILLISMIWALSFFWPLILGEKLSVEYFVFSYIKNNPNLYLFSTIIFFAIFLKLFFYKIVDFFNGASNFNVSADKIWLYTMFRISVVIFVIELLIYFVFPFTMQLFLYQGLPWLCFGALIWLSVLTVYYNFNHSTAKNIYLFSYICTAEILPLVIFYKLLIGGI